MHLSEHGPEARPGKYNYWLSMRGRMRDLSEMCGHGLLLVRECVEANNFIGAYRNPDKGTLKGPAHPVRSLG